MTGQRDVDLGRVVAAGGALLLILSLFLSWYDLGLSGWNAFETWDVVLAALAVLAIFELAPALARRGRVISVPPLAQGVVALVIVLLHLVNPPPAAAGSAPDFGAWLALAGAAAILAGHALARASVSVSLRTDPAAGAAAAPPAGPQPVPPAPPTEQTRVAGSSEGRS